MTSKLFTENGMQCDNLTFSQKGVYSVTNELSLIMIHSVTSELFTDNDTQYDKLTFH